MSVEDPLARLQEAIGYTFEDLALLSDALTHRSFLNERPNLARCDNERMEFLGDAILNLAASALLWRQYPAASEGELTRRRADLVCESSFATIARVVGLGECLRLGRGEEKSGGRDKPRLLASALEALGTRLVEGSVFLSLYEVEQIFRAEACAAGANVVLISSEAYGVPFMGTHAVGTLYRKQEKLSMRAEE